MSTPRRRGPPELFTSSLKKITVQISVKHIHAMYNYLLDTAGIVIGPFAVAATPDDKIPTYGISE